MFSYQHRYHAGAFADVHKHLVLVALIKALQKKPTPFAVLDLLAGEGLYDIQSKESQKTGEFKQGFSKILAVEHAPTLIQNYIDIIAAYNPTDNKHIYPGSPGFAVKCLRDNDQLLCVEAHPQAITQLKKHFRRHPQVHIHERDAYEALKALIPFKEKRGLILIDPSYEVKTEYKDIAKALKSAFDRFAQGTYAVWYPILPENHHQQLLQGIQRSELTKVWYCEWTPLKKAPEKGLQASGMVIVNMPFQVDRELKDTFAWLNKHVYKQGVFKEGWI
ncbi:MAG: 23S rRNA (adenine(2030)-N(6))-methyltransferase RlmJ [Proteobacteria bacterium]|nr:23S rRNA (adenine(2030)-N(6))-methyltransferase RlmJ [Pseudomonadota bacterium]